MTLNNLKLALQLNNAEINQEINIIIDYINQLITNQKILHYELNNDLDDLNLNINNINSNLIYEIALVRTTLTNSLNSLHDDYIDHKGNTVIHVTQDDKDLWNATLQNAKDYAKSLFDSVTNFRIILCNSLPEEDIQEMAIYFLRITQEDNDLYEEYMYINNQWEKIGNTRIDLSDYVTNAVLQAAIDTINATINDLEDDLTKAISDLEDKHDSDIQNLQENTEQIISNLETNLTKSISDLEDDLTKDISDLKNKHDDDISYIKRSLLNLNNILNQVHVHNNKQVLDNLTQEVIDNSHTHDNKNILDNFDLDAKDNLLYDNKIVINEFTEQDVKALIDYLWNIEEYNFFSSDNKYILTKDGYIFTAKEGDTL